MHWIELVLGLIAMLLGAKWLVDGTVRLSHRLGFSEFIVSVVVIGIGTCTPELFVSVISGARDLGTLVLSNNVASNIINIFGVLGIGALISPIIVGGERHTSDVVFMLIASVALTVLVMFGTIGFWGGMALFGILFAYLWHARRESGNNRMPPARRAVSIKGARDGAIWKMLILIIIGILAIYVGSEVFINSLDFIADAYDLDQTISGILIVGPGTAIPELLVTIIAALRRRPQIAVGNIVGSNLMNIVLVISTGAVIIDLPVSAHIAYFDIWVMGAATLIMCYDVLVRGKISRATGAMYIGLLALYLWAAVVVPLA